MTTMRKALVPVVIHLCAVMAFAAADEVKTAEDLVARHLASIGTPEARAAAKSRGVDGPAKFQFLVGGSGHSEGTAKMASEGHKLRFVINFNTTTYTGEDFVTDGSKADIASTVSGKRSLLGGFLYPRTYLLKEGLFGGVLSTAWPLLDVSALKPKLRYNGLKKVEGRDLLELRYESRKSNENLQIKLYFDPATYRHVMTIYEAVISMTEAQSINPSAQATEGTQLGEGRQILRETFSDFKALDGITLPSQWTLDMINDVGGTTTMRWDFSVQHAVHAPIDPAAFKVR